MRLIDITLPTPEQNLALDEALLVESDAGETLRFWEPRQTLVVLGRSSRRTIEVDVEACDRLAVPVRRRVSGGASIVTGAGCLMYAVVVDRQQRGLDHVDRVHRHVLQRVADGLRQAGVEAILAGTSDLAVSVNGELLKFSGNSVRLLRDRALYHGTLLYDFDLTLVERLLRTPPRQPTYREQRAHGQFVTNVPASRDGLMAALADAWDATPEPLAVTPRTKADSLADEKYALDTWNDSL